MEDNESEREGDQNGHSQKTGLERRSETTSSDAETNFNRERKVKTKKMPEERQRQMDTPKDRDRQTDIYSTI